MPKELSESQLKRVVGDRIARQREELAMSLKTLANALGCDESTLRGWEDGRHSVSAPYKAALARALNTDIAALFARTFDEVSLPHSARLVETEHELPGALKIALGKTRRSLKGFRIASDYGTHNGVQTEFRREVSKRIEDGSLHVDRVEVFYGLDRLKEVLANILRYDGKPYRVKAFCLGIRETAPGMGGYIFDSHDVILGAYWPDTPPPLNSPGLQLTGDACSRYFVRYWEEIWRRGKWINKMGANDLRSVREVAIALGLSAREWLKFVEEARVLKFADGAPPLF